MPTGFEINMVLGSALNSSGPCGHAQRGVAESIDVAVTGAYPSNPRARRADRWLLT